MEGLQKGKMEKIVNLRLVKGQKTGKAYRPQGTTKALLMKNIISDHKLLTT